MVRIGRTIKSVRRLALSEQQSKEYEKPLLKKGLPDSLNPKRRSRNTPGKLDGDPEAHLMALACSPAPKGHDRWTLRLLADEMVKLEYVDTLSYETVRQVLKKPKLSLG